MKRIILLDQAKMPKDYALGLPPLSTDPVALSPAYVNTIEMDPAPRKDETIILNGDFFTIWHIFHCFDAPWGKAIFAVGYRRTLTVGRSDSTSTVRTLSRAGITIGALRHE